MSHPVSFQTSAAEVVSLIYFELKKNLFELADKAYF